MKKIIKIHGLMRSGTNFLQFMLQNNLPLDVHVHQHSWKHAVLNPNQNCDAYAITYKNIFSWLLSIFNYAKTTKFFPNYKSGDTLSDFIKKPFVYKERGTVLSDQNLIVFWNKYHNNCLNVVTKAPKLFLNYENFITDTLGHLNAIANANGVTVNDTIIYPNNQISPSHTNIVSSKSFEYNKINYYKNKNYMNELNDKDIEFVNKFVGKDIFSRLEEVSLKSS